MPAICASYLNSTILPGFRVMKLSEMRKKDDARALQLNGIKCRETKDLIGSGPINGTFKSSRSRRTVGNRGQHLGLAYLDEAEM